MKSKRLRLVLSRAAKLLPVSMFLLSLWPVTAGAGQVGPPSPPPSGMGRAQPPGAGVNEPGPFAGSMNAKVEHLREEERRKRMLADTARLVALSTELKAEVEKTSKDELSIEVVRKAAEIEKLAHDVKERMRS